MYLTKDYLNFSSKSDRTSNFSIQVYLVQNIS